MDSEDGREGWFVGLDIVMITSMSVSAIATTISTIIIKTNVTFTTH